MKSKHLSDALNRVNDVIHATLEFDAVIEKVLPELASAVGCEALAVAVREEDARWRIVDSFGLPVELRGRVFDEQQLPATNALMQTGKAAAAFGADNPLLRAGIAGGLGVQSMMVAPLPLPGQRTGVVVYAYLSGPGVFGENELDFARKASASLGLALENARLYERERRIADRLQEALLSLPDRLHGVEFAHAYRSATEAARVGGDFYDLFEMDGGMVGIIIGDVAGKGLEASVLTSLVKNAIRAHASEKGASPAAILRLTNELVYRSTAPESFATVFFGVFDPADGRLVYANAGHEVGAVVREDSDVTHLHPTGRLIGAFPDAEFEQHEVCLGTGDVLFLYTDGLTEARRGSELFDDERLFDLLGSLRGLPPAEVARGVIDEVLDFAGGTLGDDLAIMALRRVGEEQEAPDRRRLHL